jgi:proteasome lid subunit RPN8/RPN11
MFDKDTLRQLLDYWVPTRERVGLVLSSGEIVELRNRSPLPEVTFMVTVDDIEAHPTAVAFWHTHPRNNVWLSAEDHAMFLRTPQLLQYIVAERRIRSYEVASGKVLNRETLDF